MDLHVNVCLCTLSGVRGLEARSSVVAVTTRDCGPEGRIPPSTPSENASVVEVFVI